MAHLSMIHGHGFQWFSQIWKWHEMALSRYLLGTSGIQHRADADSRM